MTSHIQKCHIIMGGPRFLRIFVCAVCYHSHLCLTFSEYCVSSGETEEPICLLSLFFDPPEEIV
jgi:hypothetical protein